MVPVRWKWWRTDGTPAEGMEEAVRVLEAVLRRNPGHPGANHFYIHAVEMSPSPERAIPSAQRLMGLVPAAGHLVHMPAHIWMILGDYQTVVDTNERAAEVDRRYMNATGVTGSSYVGYYVHNLHFVAVAKQMQGKLEDSVKAAETLAAAAAPFVKDMAAMVDAFLPAPLFALMRFGQWDRVLALGKPDERLLASTALWHWGRAIALQSKGQDGEARRESKLFEAARAKVPADWAWINNKASDILEIAAHALQAKLSTTDGASIPHWRRAVEIEGRLTYDEPPPWFYPLRESLGAALLRAGQAAEAETVFREGVRRTPRNGRMLFGLMESLKAQKKTSAAESVQREFESAWKRADVTLSVAGL
jgi:tetratricopeptide (TPR) repeat protein